MSLLHYTFMQRALVAAVLIGITAPAVGVYLVQRRLALIGDGLGHVALAGVALGVLTGAAPVGTALLMAVAGAVVVELVRSRGHASGDIALAILFYGGIAGGVVLISRAPGGMPNLNSYLFGAIVTTSWTDVWVFAILSVVVLGATIGLRLALFAVSNDEEFAVASGMPVLALNLLLAVMTAVTVVVSMRVVGLLLVSALMIVPVATSQLVARSFAATMALAMAIGVVVSVAGVVVSYDADTPSGGTIILLAIGLFALVAAGRAAIGGRVVSARARRDSADGSRRSDPSDRADG